MIACATVTIQLIFYIQTLNKLSSFLSFKVGQNTFFILKYLYFFFFVTIIFIIIENKESIETVLFNQGALQEYILICCQNREGGLIDKPGK